MPGTSGPGGSGNTGGMGCPGGGGGKHADPAKSLPRGRTLPQGCRWVLLLDGGLVLTCPSGSQVFSFAHPLSTACARVSQRAGEEEDETPARQSLHVPGPLLEAEVTFLWVPHVHCPPALPICKLRFIMYLHLNYITFTALCSRGPRMSPIL